MKCRKRKIEYEMNLLEMIEGIVIVFVIDIVFGKAGGRTWRPMKNTKGCRSFLQSQMT